MQGMHIMDIAKSTLLQIIVVWVAGAGIALIGAVVKGGGKLVTSYFPLSFLLGPIAIVWLIFDRRKACPFCHNVLKPSLKVCPHRDHRLVYPHL